MEQLVTGLVSGGAEPSILMPLRRHYVVALRHQPFVLTPARPGHVSRFMKSSGAVLFSKQLLLRGAHNSVPALATF